MKTAHMEGVAAKGKHTISPQGGTGLVARKQYPITKTSPAEESKGGRKKSTSVTCPKGRGGAVSSKRGIAERGKGVPEWRINDDDLVLGDPMAVFAKKYQGYV